jgi:hypothetical protein
MGRSRDRGGSIWGSVRQSERFPIAAKANRKLERSSRVCRQPMRAMFTIYLALIVAGLVGFTLIGLL